MMNPSSRPARKVQIADHIWGAFEEMASQMGSDRDALINQATMDPAYVSVADYVKATRAGGSFAVDRVTPPRLIEMLERDNHAALELAREGARQIALLTEGRHRIKVRDPLTGAQANTWVEVLAR